METAAERATANTAVEVPFYAPRATEDPNHFELEAVRGLCVGPRERPFLMGGVGLASAIDVMERVTGRPLLWATAQFLSYVEPGSSVSLHVETPVSGRQVSQARAVSRVGDREIIAVAAALGGRDGAASAQFARPPTVRPPEACEVLSWDIDHQDDLMATIERRHATRLEGPDPSGRIAMWMRTRHDVLLAPGLLAIFADFLPGGLAVSRGSMSLDNTLRIHALPPHTPAGWVLCDVRVSGLAHGAFHGEMNLFDEAGTLLATASQSAMLPRQPLSTA